MAPKVGAVVDPGETAEAFSREFEKRGYRCLIILTGSGGFAAMPADESVIVIYHEDLPLTLTQLSGHDVRCVIAGGESGVSLADRLSENLHLSTNGVDLSEARRNKYLMHLETCKHGLAVPDQICSDRLGELVEWANSRGRWPVVIKPLNSTSSEDVCCCDSDDAIRRWFENTRGHRNKLGYVNQSAIVQEFVEGTEYVVDTVSSGGRHKAAAFWRYGKPADQAAFIGYDSMELLPSTGEIQSRLFEYAAGVLDALGIRHGPAHCEVILRGGQPVLVEAGARPNGGKNSLVAAMCMGQGQISLTIDAYLDQVQFQEAFAHPYVMHQNALIAFLMPGRLGILKRLGSLAVIEDLPSVREVVIGVREGQPLPRVAGVVTLIHEDRAVIQRDLRRIRDFETGGLYDIDEFP